MEGLWGFLLNRLPDGRTRLVISGYQTLRPRWQERFVVDWLYMPCVWAMQARTLAVLKRNIERAARAPAQAIPSGGTALPGECLAPGRKPGPPPADHAFAVPHQARGTAPGPAISCRHPANGSGSSREGTSTAAV